MNSTNTLYSNFRIILFLVFLLFTTSNLFAQNNFIPGYLVLLKGDTLHGHINDKEWDQNPTEIEFQVKDGGINYYNAGQLKSFHLSNGFTYESHFVEYLVFSKRYKDIEKGIPPKKFAELVFLRVLIKGDISLYELKDPENNKRLFLSSQEEPLYELVYLSSIISLQNSSVPGYTGTWYTKNLKTKKVYISQLKRSLKACPKLKPEIRGASYGTKDFTKLLLNYYECLGEEASPDFVSPHRKTIRVRPHLMAGFATTNLLMKGELPRWMEGYNTQSSQNPIFGLGVDFEFQRRQKQLSLAMEFYYKTQQYRDDFSVLHSSVFTDNGYWQFDINYLRLNLLFKHTLPFNKIKPFYKIGMGHGFIASHVNKVDYDKISNAGTVEHIIDDLISPFKDFEQSFVAGVGVQFFEHYEIELRVDLGSGSDDSGKYSSKTRSFMAMGRYRF